MSEAGRRAERDAIAVLTMMADFPARPCILRLVRDVKRMGRSTKLADWPLSRFVS